MMGNKKRTAGVGPPAQQNLPAGISDNLYASLHSKS